MENSLTFSFKKVFFAALLLLLIINILGTYSEDVLFLQITKALFIPVLLTFFFIKNKTLSIPFIAFFVFSFLGDLSLAFFESSIFVKMSSIFYFLSYMCLIGIAVLRVKIFEIDKIVGTYLIVVFLINAYFLYVLYGVLQTIVPDSLEVFLFGVKNISLVLLTFLAFGKYLVRDTKTSILFLMVALCLAFSTVLNYVCMYYVYNWSFVMIERVLYAVGVYLLLNYVMELNKEPKKEQVEEEIFNSKTIFS